MIKKCTANSLWLLVAVLSLSIQHLEAQPYACPQHKFQEAKTLYEEAAALRADNPKAIPLLQQSTEACGLYQNFYRLAYNLLVQEEHLDEANTAVENALKLATSSANKVKAWWLMGRIHWQHKKLTKAKAAFDAAFASVGEGEAALPELVEDAPMLEQGLSQAGLYSSELIATVLKNALSMTRATGVAPRISLQIQFDTNKAELKPAGRVEVRQVAEALVQPGLEHLQVRVIGHTDVRGSAEYNQRLSEQRAQTVYAELIQLQSLTKERVFPSGRGEQRPRARGIPENAGDEAHAINRRVEFELQIP